MSAKYNFICIKDNKRVLNEELLIEFERHLYNAFDEKTWLKRNGTVIDNCRLIPPLNYEDILIYCALSEGKLVAGISGNINIDSTLQLEKMGFNVDKSVNNIGEGINFFISENSGIDIFSILGGFLENVFKEMKKFGVRIIYSTCSKKQLNIYELFGFDTIDELLVDGEMKYLLKYVINE